MVDTRKFSEFLDGGELSKDDTTVGLRSGNTKFKNSLPMLPPGTTADRPAPDTSMSNRLRLNTTDELYEYYNPTTSAWVSLATGGAPSDILALLASHAAGEGASLVGLQDIGAVLDKTIQDLALAGFIAKTDNGTLHNGQFLGQLDTGMLKSTTTSGDLSVLTGSDAITAIIDDITLATAANTNIATALAVRTYVLNQLFPVYTVTATVRVATTAALGATYANGTAGVGATLTANANGAAVIDGITLNVNDLVLVKNEGGGFTSGNGANGIYVVTDTGSAGTPYIFTRDTDYDEVAEFVVGNVFEVTAGSTNGGTEWILTNAPTVINGNADTPPYISYEPNLAAEVSGYVNLIGNENIYGVKTYKDPLLVDNFLATPILTVTPTPENLNASGNFLTVEVASGDAFFLTDPATGIWIVSGEAFSIDTGAGFYFDINNTQGINAIIDDDTMATASDRNIATSESIVAYIESTAQRFKFLNPTKVATTANFASTYDNGTAGVGATLTASSNGAASIDGVALALTDRVLFKNQTNTFENGIYDVTQVGDGSTPAIYTRATDFDEPSEMDAGEIATVVEGTVNAGTGWLLTTTVATIGTDPVVWIDFIPDINNVVTLDGTQTITGNKTFSGTVDFGLTDGQFLIGETGNPANKASIVGGTGISVNYNNPNVEISADSTGDSLQLSLLTMGG